MTRGNRGFRRGERQHAERLGDMPPPVPNTRAQRRCASGLTIIELIVTLAVLGVAFAIAVPRAPRGAFSMWRGHAQLVADLRQTRADALTRGDHFVFEVLDATRYAEHRMTWNGAGWVKNIQPTRMRVLPDGIVFSAGTGAQFEFNTRGLLVLPGAAQSLRLRETASGLERQITVWPSGQVAPI
jgi:prepilin-type N-terminal cleavage/methylation domain-containing protein